MAPCLGPTLSWTCCTDDLCLVHVSEKEGSGWYPQPQSREGQRWADEMDYEQGGSGGEVCVEDADESSGENEVVGDT